MLDKGSRLSALKTYSLQGIVVPDAIFKDWSRRKGNHHHHHHNRGGGGNKARGEQGGRDGHHHVVAQQQQQQQPSGHTHHTEADTGGQQQQQQQQQWASAETLLFSHEEQAAFAAQGLGTPAAAASAGGRDGDDADASYVSSSVAYRLQRIRRMAPADDRGMWLLNNLLAQTRLEEKEDLCRSVHDKLTKRKECLVRTKDRRKLECDRRCVFTKSANETRTTSGMMAESNRFNVLASIVKDHLNAKLRQKERHSHRTVAGQNTHPTSTLAAAAAPTTTYRGDRPAATPHSRHPPSRPRMEKVDRGSPRPTVRTAVPARNLRGGSTKTATAAAAAAAAAASAVSSNSPIAAEAQNKRQRLLPAQTLPMLAHSPSRGVSKTSAGISPASPPSPLPPVSQDATPAAAEAIVAPRREVPGKHGAGLVQPLGLPPLQERYGAGVVASWAQAPLALRLGRRRCQSVAIAELDREAYEEYMERVLRPTASSDQRQRLATPEGGGDAKGKGRRSGGKGGGGGGGGGGWKREVGREGDVCSSTKMTTQVKPRAVGGSEAVPESNCRAQNSGVIGGEDAPNQLRSPSGATAEGPAATDAISDEVSGFDQPSDPSRFKGGSLAASTTRPSEDSPSGDNVGEHPTTRGPETCSAAASNTPVNPRHQRLVSFASGECPSTAEVSPDAFLQNDGGDGGGGGGGRGKRRGRTLDGRGNNKPLPVADTLTSTGLTFRSGDARKLFKQTERLLESLRTPARSSSIGRMNHGGVGGNGLGKDGRPSAVVVRYQTSGARGIFAGGRNSDLLGNAETWRGANKLGDRLARLAEVFRCVAPPHTVRIECDLHLHDAMGKAERGGRDRDAGSGGGGGGGGGGRVAAVDGDRGGMWDDFVQAWEYLGDGILAGRALYKYWEHVDGIRGDHSVAPKSERATDDLLSDGLMRALLFTRCYRSPGLDQLFVEWLDELLEAVREHVCRGCSKLPSLHGLTVGMGWFHEVCSTASFGSRRRFTSMVAQ